MKNILILVAILLTSLPISVYADGGATGTSCGGCLCKPAAIDKDSTRTRSGSSTCW